VVHLLRNSFRYAARQDWDKIAKALKPVYTAPTEDAATERFLEFAETWGRKYPAVVKLWENAWAEFVPFLAFDVEIRKVICSTNAIVILSFGLGHGCDLRVCVEDGVADAAQRGVLRRFRRGGSLPKGDPRVRCGVFVGRCAGRRARARVVA
jgi:hypothetical protein